MTNLFARNERLLWRTRFSTTEMPSQFLTQYNTIKSWQFSLFSLKLSLQSIHVHVVHWNGGRAVCRLRGMQSADCARFPDCMEHIRWLLHCACVRACNWGCLVLDSQRTKTPKLKPYGQNTMLLGKHYYYVWASARLQCKLSFLHTNCMHTTLDKGARQQHRSGNLILKTNKINKRTHARTRDTWHVTHAHTHTHKIAQTFVCRSTSDVVYVRSKTCCMSLSGHGPDHFYWQDWLHFTICLLLFGFLFLFYFNIFFIFLSK